jgi:succinate dehydrogenase / fumarate reductase cytochrome b subunit
MRFGLIPGLNMTPIAGNADLAYDIVAREFAIPWVMALYMAGIAATAWHLAYGFWLFAVDWGIVIGANAQKYALYACIALAVGLFGMGANAAVSFVRPCGLFPEVLCEQKPEANKVTRPPESRRF